MKAMGKHTQKHKHELQDSQATPNTHIIIWKNKSYCNWGSKIHIIREILSWTFDNGKACKQDQRSYTYPLK
jgi:hypothetical protein